MSNNPLSNYFRQPSIYLKLPSNGNFYPENTLDMPPNNELPIYPMTAIDEITYRTPDALYNGTAVMNVIKSCVPNILDPWIIPAVDFDAILASIRIASYGHSMEIDTTCPACKETATYSLDLRTILDQLKSPDYQKSVNIGDLNIFFKPLSYKQINENSVIQFEEQKLASVLEDAEMEEEEKLKRLSAAFASMTELSLKALTQNINYIKTPDNIVKEEDFINDFLHNCDRVVYKRIKDYVIGMKNDNELKPLNIKCNEKDCGHEYEQPFTLDMSNFFG